MNIFKVVFKQYLENKSRTLLSLVIVILLASLMLFVFADLNIGYKNKFKRIEKMPKNHLILDNGVFFGKEDDLKYNYNVSFYQPNYMQISQSIDVALVSDDFFTHGTPYPYDVFVSSKNVFENHVLYGDLDGDDEESERIINPIVIDETTSLKRFNKMDTVGRTMILNVDGIDVVFTVIAVIRETPVRQNYLEYLKTLNREEYIEDIGRSQAFVFESNINKLTNKTTKFSLAQIVSDNKLTEDETNEILINLDIDYKGRYYDIASYSLYEKSIKTDYNNSIISNVIILTIVFIAFIIIFLINLFHGLRKNKQEISYMKTIGVAQKTQIKIVLFNWLIIILSGIIISLIITTPTLLIIHGIDFFISIKIFTFVLSGLLLGLSLLTISIVVPISMSFIKKTPYTLFRMDEESWVALYFLKNMYKKIILK